MNRRHTLALVLLFILAVAALWASETKPWAPPAVVTRGRDPLRIFTLLLPRVVTIKLENHQTGETVSVWRSDNQSWWLSEPEQRQLDADKMLQMGLSLTSLSAERVLTDTTVLDSFGLAQPTFTVHIMAADAEQILDIGKPTPIGGAFYAKRRDEPPIYLVSSKTLDELRHLLQWLPTAIPTEHSNPTHR